MTPQCLYSYFRRQAARSCLLLLIFLSISSLAISEEEKEEEPCTLKTTPVLFGNWNGVRKNLADKGVDLEFVYSFDLNKNMTGGISHDFVYLDNFDLSATFDMEKLVHWKGATFFLYGVGNEGGSPSARAGDLQALSNIDAPDFWRLHCAWYQQNFLENKLSFLVGLFDINSEFDSMENASLFLGSSHGIGPDYSQTGQNGPSIFPSTALSARVKITPHPQYYLQAAVMDGVPGDINNPTSPLHVSLSKADGALISSEIGFLPGSTSEDPGHGKFALGSWIYTSKFDDVLDVDGNGDPVRRSGNFGIYALGEYKIYKEDEESEQGLGVFGRVGYANPHLNQLVAYTGGGLNYTGLIPKRNDDQMGLAVAVAFNGSDFKTASSNASTPVNSAETAIEWTYRMQILPWLAVQPDIQYIIHPGTDPAPGNAFVLSSRFEIQI